jgi:AcrR family transcriptional regulator
VKRPDGSPSPARTGRRPGSPDTRDLILEAARDVFAQRGYDGATVRGVAAQAGVDPALLYHYFGSKQQLFVAAMDIPYDWQTALPVILSGPADQMGQRLVRFILTLWESPRTQPLFLGAVRSAATDPVAAAMVRGLLAEGPFTALATVIGAPDGDLRAMLAASHVMGVALLRYILRVEPIASADIETLVGIISPAIQRYLAGDLGPGEVGSG